MSKRATRPNRSGSLGTVPASRSLCGNTDILGKAAVKRHSCLPLEGHAPDAMCGTTGKRSHPHKKKYPWSRVVEKKKEYNGERSHVLHQPAIKRNPHDVWMPLASLSRLVRAGNVACTRVSVTQLAWTRTRSAIAPPQCAARAAVNHRLWEVRSPCTMPILMK